MSMAYIRKTYGVPAKRGRVVEVWEWRRWGRTTARVYDKMRWVPAWVVAAGHAREVTP